MGSAQSRLYNDRRASLSSKLTNLSPIPLPDRLRTKSRKRKLVISPPLYSASTIWPAPSTLPVTTATTPITNASPNLAYQPTFWYNDAYPHSELDQCRCSNGSGNGGINGDSPQCLRLSSIAEEAPCHLSSLTPSQHDDRLITVHVDLQLPRLRNV
ncbi:hypothetical protein DV737_g1450, partial [Chaetothyriales sp. CBS 132003]